MREPVIIDSVRTPLGRRGGTLASVRSEELYAHVINSLLTRTGFPAAKVEDVVTGCVTQTGEQGANVGRIAALLSNLPKEVPAVTLSRLCGSSQQAIHFAAQAVAAGDMDFVIAGGAESMSRVPMFSDIGGGFEKLGPGLAKKYTIVHQGESAERIAEKYSLSRAALDEFSMQSHARAAKAISEKRFDKELAPLTGTDKEGKPTLLSRDEGVRFPVDPAKMASLAPVFRKDGVITAGNSSQISDGAAALLVADREKALAYGLKPRARFRSRVAVGGDPTLQLLEVIPATRKALEKAGLALSDIDVIEVNEAFASVVLAWASELKPDLEKVNPHGGAIAHGHPLGATGAVLMTKLLHDLEQRDLQFGLQVMCIGHGMATATVIERV